MPRVRAAEAFARGVQLADSEPTLAIASFQQSVEADPKQFIAHYNLGVLHERIGDDLRAEQHYLDCLRVAGDYAPAVGNLVNLYLRRGDLVKAVAVARDAAEKRSERLDLRNLLVKALLAVGRRQEAAQEAKAILREDEKNVGAMVLLATVYFEQGKFELSAHALRMALKVDPENPEAHHRLGHALLALEEKARAREAFQKAVELRRDFPEALNSLAMVLLSEGDVGRALNLLEEAVRLSPGFLAARLNLGNAYRKAGDLGRAKAAYEKVLKLRSAHPEALYNLALLYLDHPMPDATDEIRRLEVALEYFGRLRQTPGGDTDATAKRYAADAGRKLAQLRQERERREARERLKKLRQDLEGQKLRMGGK
jgi:Flp pilus assembly protein TadD